MADQEEQRAPPRGRGARLLEAFRKIKEKPGSSTSTEPSEPPKPRGRAALFQRLAELKETQSIGKTTTTTTEEVTTVTESLATTAINEPCLFQGTSGTVIGACCNYIRLTLQEDYGVFEYNVQFNPLVDAKSVRMRTVSTHIGNTKLFDGGAILYIPKQLPSKRTEFKCVNPHDNSEFIMTVTYVKPKRLGDSLHLLNILFKRIMYALLYSPIGRNYFDPQHTQIIPQHKLEILPGYAVAVDEYEGGVMVCLDTQHRVMRTQTVLDALLELRAMRKEAFKEAALKTIVGACVLTRYNNKTYTITDILWDLTPMATFETQDGRTISYMQYYKNQYNITILDTEQPLLLNMQSKKVSGQAEKVERFICLIPELCNLTGLTDEMRADFRVMKDVAVHTRVTPSQRLKALKQYLDNIEKNSDAKGILQAWGLKIENATLDLLARVLDPETIMFGEGVKAVANKADWNNMVTKNKVLGPVDLLKWYVFHTPRDVRFATDFAQTMQRLAGPMGMKINKPILHQLQDDRTATYVNTMKSIISPEIQALVFICPTMRDDRYAAIKQICCSQMPIISQVINSRTLSNPQKVRGIIQKIALQINCKLGGTLWTVRIPVQNWMVCGIDVYHSPGLNQSVCAFVSSLDENMSRWYSTAIFQKQELGDQLKMAFAKSLEKYRETNGLFPTNVIIFRDGVGDGQFQHCRTYEVEQFEQCIKDYKIDNLKLTLIVVQKRINTRIFMGKNAEQENPPPGTIVDNTITRRNWYDFFLVAQQVRQGTVTPTHYVVIYDAAKLKPDHVQRLSFKLCHMYYNWPGTIRVPAPCQYAHKLAYLIGQHVKKAPAAILADRLYYL